LTLEELLPLHDIPLRWHAGGALLAAAMLSIHCRARSTHIVAVCIIRLPGVVLHELAHLLCGILLRAEPAGFSLIPQCRGAGRWTLGSVTFRRVTAFNAVPIALAPLGLLPLAYLVWCYWFSLLRSGMPACR
jgi:hypothetical protein